MTGSKKTKAQLLAENEALRQRLATLDITERKRVEEELQKSQERNSNIANSVPVLISYVDDQQRYQFNNMVYEDWFGTNPTDLIGKQVSEVLGASAYEYLLPYIQGALEGKNQLFEMEIPYQDGGARYVQGHYVPHFGEHNEVLGFYAVVTDITELKRTEEELRDSQMLLQTIFDTIPHSVFVRDTSGNFVMVNKTMAIRNGLDPEQFLQKDIWEIAPELKKNRSDYVERDRIVIETGETIKASVMAVILPDGTERLQQATKAPLRNEAGNVVGVVGISEDVTERLQAEEKLRLSEERFRLVFDNSPSLIALKDLDGRFLFANKGLANFFGISPEEIVGKHSRDIHGEELSEFYVSQDREVLETGNTIESELDLQAPDGSMRTLVNIKFPVYDIDGKPQGVGVISTDVTGRKQAEENLRVSQDLLREVFNAIPHHVFFKDLKGRYQVVNRSFVDYWGIDPDHPADWSTKDLPVADEQLAEFFRDTDRKVLQTGLKVDENFQFKKMDGSETFRRQIKVPFRNQSGEIVGIIGLSEDVTERRRAEEELQSAHDHIRSMSSRMRNFEETERRHFARELHDEIGQYLTGLKIQLQALRDRPKQEVVTDKLKACLQIVDVLLKQVRNLAFDLRPMKLDDLGLSAALRWLIDQQANIGGFTSQYSEVGKVDSVPTELATICFRVVQEALTNVVRHAGAAHIRVELQRFDGVIQLLVEDDGKGFDTSEATMRARAGESMGLLGMQERVELTGGQFEINSTAGKGTTIRATISHKSAIPV